MEVAALVKDAPKFINDYLTIIKESQLASPTIKRYLSDLQVFTVWFVGLQRTQTHLTVTSLSEDDYRAFINYLEIKKYSDATIRRLTSVLNGLLKHYGMKSLYLSSVSKKRPLRALTKDDFISIREYKMLIKSVSNRSEALEKPARDYLIERNTSILHLMRYYGLTPIEVSQLSMSNLNLAQQKLTIQNKVIVLDRNLAKIIGIYLTVIDKKVRPKLHSDDPLFVSFNNTSMSFQYDYTYGQPKRLSERGIQEMVKDEVKRAGLRRISSLNLRNQSILESIILEYTDHQIVDMYGLSSPLSLHRYKKYWESIQEEINEK